MADTVIDSDVLVLVAGFVDEDDRTITVPNPKENLTKAQIEAALGTTAEGVIIGDKYAAAFSRWKSAKYRSSHTIRYDLKQ